MLPVKLLRDPRDQLYFEQLHRRFVRLALPAREAKMTSIFRELLRRRIDPEDVIAALGVPEPEALEVQHDDDGFRSRWTSPPPGPGARAGQLLAAYRADAGTRAADHRARVAATRRGDLGVSVIIGKKRMKGVALLREVKVKGKAYNIGIERSARSHWRRAPLLLGRGNPYRAIRAAVRHDLDAIRPKLPRRLIDGIITVTLK